MTRKLYFGVMLLMWLSLPIIAIQFRQNWDRLPVRMATHFNAVNQPNGWMTREQALWSSLEILAIVLTSFTLVLVFSHRKKEITSFSWALLAFFYVIVGLACYVVLSTLYYNRDGRPINFTGFGVVFGAALIGIITAYAGFHRGASLSSSPMMVEEVHAVRVWALLFLPIIVIELGAIVFLRNSGLRLGLALVCLVLIMALAAVWSGFHYYFSPQGMEVRTLGFRLKSVPADRIRHYSIERWSPVGGYGIRGVGNNRAYVWSNRGVRIVTSDGQIFLGHKEPERIVRDLDAMIKFGRT